MASNNVRVGEVRPVRIEDVAFGGMGVGRIEGMVVFVPNSVTHDVLEVEIKDVRKKYVQGEIRGILAPSEFRVDPACPYFGECGGCQLQHVTYDYQLEAKRKQVREIYARLGRFTMPVVLDIIPSPKRYHYRGKADFHVQSDRGKVKAVGFMHSSEARVVDIERCQIVEESINHSYGMFRTGLFQKNPPSPLFSQGGDSNNSPFNKGGQGGFGQSQTRRQTIWSVVESPEVTPADPSSAPWLIHRIVQGRHFTVPYEGFFQVNTSITGSLVDQILACAGLQGYETVLDGYCGVGLFSLFFAPVAGTVTGIELDGDAVICARNNLAEAGIENSLILQGDMGSVMKERFKKNSPEPDLIVLDPPRMGCGKDVLDEIIRIKPKQVIYVSCNPSTQARDVRYLVDQGFTLESLRPLDMFPQTAHIEVIAVLGNEAHNSSGIIE